MIIFFVGMVVLVFVQAFSTGTDETSETPITPTFKADVPHFNKTPNNTALKQKWSKEDDFMILVIPETNTVQPFYIDAFEAVISNHRAWSVPDQVPTDRLRFDDAIVACQAAGKRLCKVEEWQTACRGGRTTPISFNRAKDMIRDCNVAQRAKQDGTYLKTTSSNMGCITKGLPLFNMIGNVAEFVQTKEGESMIVGLTYHDGRKPQAGQLLKRACEQVVAKAGEYPAELYSKGVGFRCCADAN